MNTLRTNQKVSISELARRVHMSKSTVSLYFNGSREFPINRLEEFARALHTTPEEVLSVRNDEQLTNTAYSLPDSLQQVTIPIVDKVKRTDAITAKENVIGYTTEVFRSPSPQAELFAVRCQDRTMEPSIPDGALVIASKQADVNDGEIAVVLVTNNILVLRRIKHQEKALILIPDSNDEYPVIVSQNHQGKIVGKAIRYSVDLRQK